MQLVEIIRGDRTSDETLAHAFDFVRQIGKTPIVVNDFARFLHLARRHDLQEGGHHMLEEGVPAALVENAGKAAGMPVGPLALADEVALDLSLKILQATRADLGDAYQPGPIDRVMEEMVEKRGRFGRKNGKGFYDYPAGRKNAFGRVCRKYRRPRTASAFSFDELKERLLLIQALETARCFDEGVLDRCPRSRCRRHSGFRLCPFHRAVRSPILIPWEARPSWPSAGP